MRRVIRRSSAQSCWSETIPPFQKWDTDMQKDQEYELLVEAYMRNFHNNRNKMFGGSSEEFYQQYSGNRQQSRVSSSSTQQNWWKLIIPNPECGKDLTQTQKYTLLLVCLSKFCLGSNDSGIRLHISFMIYNLYLHLHSIQWNFDLDGEKRR